VNAPHESINTLLTLIDKENQEGADIFVIICFDKCWDEKLKLALLEKAKDPALKPKCTGKLLEELLKQGLAETRDFAKSLIFLPLPLVENDREKVLIAARVLIENPDPSSWSFIWSLIQQDTLFGREVLELVAYRYSHGIQLNLTETQLADLYVWLVCQYPFDEDPDYSNEVLAHCVTAREGMANLRDNVLTQLKERGTRQACDEIQSLIQKLPEISWLRRILIDAKANMRRKTWQPPTPAEILQLVVSQEPSNTDLSNKLDNIDRRTQKMADEPKVDQSVHITNSEVSGGVNTGSGKIENKIESSNTKKEFGTKKEFDWKFWLSISITVTVALISVAASGVFNEEIKNFLFNRNTSPQIEQKLEKKTN
jgi:hypothetical protein